MRSDIDSVRENLLVLRAQAREAGAFSELVARYERRVLYYLHRLLGDADLADVMQEIWIRVFLKIPTLRAPGAFRTWTYKIAHDTAVSLGTVKSRLHYAKAALRALLEATCRE